MKIALIGNQNSGKTTLFNLLTGSNQKVGNWPGVTIEKKCGYIKNTNYELYDLPGIYSLSPFSNEEEISRRFIFDEKPNLIINIIDATSIERSLYLTTQLLELDTKVIVALNMSDILSKKGLTINLEALERELGVPVVKISARKKLGIEELIATIRDFNSLKYYPKTIYNSEITNEIKKISAQITTPHKQFVSVKLLEKDKMFMNYYNEEIEVAKNKIEKNFSCEMVELIASQRYDWIVNVKDKVITKEGQLDNTTDKLDKIFLNKYLAIPIFIVIMFLIYFLSVGVVGSWTVEIVEEAVSLFSEWLEKVLLGANASSWSISLIIDGIVAGVGAVLNFIPQLMVLFLCISILETTGYMSRISFLLDKIFKKFGLSGKSLIPFIVGSGCSVPGIMATRTIDDENERKMTILLTPFVPCSAKLPIIALFAGFFFGEYAGLVSASLYFLSVIVIIISAILLKKLIYKGESTGYISELPEYKMPSLTYVSRDVYSKTWSFIQRAGSVILLSSIIIWVLLSFDWRLRYGVDVNQSILATIGKSISWFFYPMIGENSWGAAVSAIQGLVAKEQVVSSMAIINGLSDDITSGNLIFNQNGIFSFFTGASAYAFMVFNLFSAPCIGSMGAMKREFGSTKYMLKAIMFQTGLAWLLATLIYWTSQLIGVIF